MTEYRRPSLEAMASFMEETLEREGATPLGVGWRTTANQELRFAQLIRLIDGESRDFSVNDLGCGMADLCRFIRGRGLPMTTYRGFDISAKMLAVARDRIAPDAELIQGDRLTQRADYSFACGIFHTRLDADKQAWLDYMKSVIHDLHDHSTRGFAFNSFTTYVDWMEPHLFYADPIEFFRFCKEEISPRVALFHDYPLYEWTMLVRRVEDG